MIIIRIISGVWNLKAYNMITKEHLNKYKEIYKEEYGQEISDKDALNELTALVGYMSAVEKYQNQVTDKNHETK